MIDTNVMAGIQAQVLTGSVAKENSHYVTDDETAQFWDDLVAEKDTVPEGASGPFIYDIVRE